MPSKVSKLPSITSASIVSVETWLTMVVAAGAVPVEGVGAVADGRVRVDDERGGPEVEPESAEGCGGVDPQRGARGEVDLGDPGKVGGRVDDKGARVDIDGSGPAELDTGDGRRARVGVDVEQRAEPPDRPGDGDVEGRVLAHDEFAVEGGLDVHLNVERAVIVDLDASVPEVAVHVEQAVRVPGVAGEHAPGDADRAVIDDDAGASELVERAGALEEPAVGDLELAQADLHRGGGVEARRAA
ncbi:MAG: hypothetical protein R3B49_03660 [Phycisphaerales bacterium]